MYRNSGARQRVLDRLLEGGPATVNELASDLGVVPVTMRSHLASLQAQGLLSGQDERGHIGRPRRRYRLTAEATALLPNRTDLLAADLLDGLQALAGSRAVDQLLDVATARSASRHSAACAGKTLDERVAAATGLLADEGRAICEDQGDRLLIHDFHCPYGHLAHDRPDVCRYHTQVLVRLIGSPVILQRSIAQGAPHCVFAVPRLPVRRPAAVRTLSDGRERT